MLSLTQCTGFFVKQKKQQHKHLRIYYFFIDSLGILYYTHNMAQLNFFIKCSSNEKELVNRFNQCSSFHQMSIQNCRTTGIKTFPAYDYVPFYHRQCFELSVLIFSTIEDDIELLQEYVRGGWSRQKSQSDQVIQELEQKVNLLDKVQKISDQQDVTYSGQMENDKPNGTGTLFFKDGISFVGEFKDGKKHGSGYIVDSNLDMIYCEYIEDQLCGI